MSTNYLVGVYKAPGKPAVMVDTPVIGNPSAEFAELWKKATAAYNNAPGITRLGSFFEDRSVPTKKFLAGTGADLQTAFQVIDENGHRESFAVVGTCMLDDEPHRVVLLNLPDRDRVGLRLEPLLRKGGTSVVFNSEFPYSTPLSELSGLLLKVLGSSCTSINLTV